MKDTKVENIPVCTTEDWGLEGERLENKIKQM